jgi:hypothetical protein
VDIFNSFFKATAQMVPQMAHKRNAATGSLELSRQDG